MNDPRGSLLTTREVEVLSLVAKGCGDKEISNQWNMGLRTVQRHLSNIYQKLEVNNRTVAVRVALEKDWLSNKV